MVLFFLIPLYCNLSLYFAGASTVQTANPTSSGTSVRDLEAELREFLESETSMGNAEMHDDQSIDEIFSVP